MQRYEKNRFPGNLFTNYWFSTRLGRMQQLFLFLPKIRMSIKKKQPLKVAFLGGETGIRTLGTRKSTPHFECGPFDHSGISPFCLRLQNYNFISNQPNLNEEK